MEILHHHPIPILQYFLNLKFQLMIHLIFFKSSILFILDLIFFQKDFY